jgi:hypothetical protein
MYTHTREDGSIYLMAGRGLRFFSAASARLLLLLHCRSCTGQELPLPHSKRDHLVADVAQQRPAAAGKSRAQRGRSGHTVEEHGTVHPRNLCVMPTASAAAEVSATEASGSSSRACKAWRVCSKTSPAPLQQRMAQAAQSHTRAWPCSADNSHLQAHKQTNKQASEQTSKQTNSRGCYLL